MATPTLPLWKHSRSPPCHSLIAAFLTLCGIFVSCIKATATEGTDLLLISVYWTSDRRGDERYPVHRHSGHILQLSGDTKEYELDLLSSSTPNDKIQFVGNMRHYTFDSLNFSLNATSILLLSCDSYISNHAKRLTTLEDPAPTFLRATLQKPKAIILYTSQGGCCRIEPHYWRHRYRHLPIFTFNNLTELTVNQFINAANGTDVQIVSRNVLVDTSLGYEMAEDDSARRLSKESALLVVYIITGLISTGFIGVLLYFGFKAYGRCGHNSTEHLGPRPRQSRTRGIARTALDTIPVVRFGSRPVESPSKDVDVEMQEANSSLEVRDLQELGNPPSSNCPSSPENSSTSASVSEFPSVYSVTNSVPIDTMITGAPLPQANQVQCPVCMDDFEEGQEIRILPCNHSFHTDCIDPWLLNVTGSCPLCRIDLRPPEERERDNNPASIFPPLPEGYGTPRNAPGINGHLSRLLEVARRTSSREERLTALRAVRDDAQGNGSRHPVRPRSRKPELGITRLRRAVFGSDGRSGREAIGGANDLHDMSGQLQSENRVNLVSNAATIGAPSSSPSSAGLR
ncbi:hypothetical protein BDZ91DRAFT_791071 [Kalaharituber pfeilii]|nr:hypothetical protein BDZ91DRAFT_791071 [Kalaharituber pfeilii]